MIKTKAIYGKDQTGAGFYWANSPQKRSEALATRRNSPYEFQAVYQCDPKALQGAIFLPTDFAYFSPPSEALFDPYNPDNWRGFISECDLLVQAWDTAGSTGASSDYSVCITAALRACDEYHCEENEELLGPCESHYDVYVLDVYREKLAYGDLVQRARELSSLWHPTDILVEQKSTGDPLLATLQQSNLPAQGRKPGILSKRARATMSVGAGSVQGWMRMHRVKWLYGAPWLAEAYNELVSFTGDDTGHDDVVDSLVYLVTFAIEQAGGVARLPTELDQYQTGAQVVSRQEQLQKAVQLRGLHQTSQYAITDLPTLFTAAQVDPFATTCQRCSSYEQGRQFCLHHNRKTFALNTCGEFNGENLLLV